jgi:SulP family sulfate permease
MFNAIKIHSSNLHLNNSVAANLKHIPTYLTRPVRFLKSYDHSQLRPDLMAGLTVAVVLLPQVIAFALIAGLPPEMGLYTAIIGAFIGALWGSCYQLQTGPVNTISLLVLSVLLPIAAPGSPRFIVAAGMLALMVGVFQLVMGLARMGVLVNFVSYSVVVGFSSGAGLLIIINELRHLLGLEFASRNVLETGQNIIIHLFDIHWPTALLGLGIIILLLLIRKFNPKLPGALISMVVASAAVFLFDLRSLGVNVIGQLPAYLPPVANLPLFDLTFIAQLSTGALAVGSIGLVQTTAMARSIASQTGQRLDSNQEFVGQGLANIASGLFSGFNCAASFSASAVNFKAGARTPLSSIFSSLVMLVAMFILAPMGVYFPRTALAAVLVITGYGMINRTEIARIWQGARGDALIMAATFLGTVFLPIEFAVLVGILLSFAIYIMKTSVPRVYPVLPDDEFKHFVQQQPHQKSCPQLGILKISGDLYFGAVNHVEEALHQHLLQNPEQRFLLLRMHGVNQCDFSGIHMMEHIRMVCQERGGDLFFMKVQKPVLDFMKSTGFYDQVGADHFLVEEQAIGYLFHKVLDPAICIYECSTRAFVECQNLPKRDYPVEISLQSYQPNGDFRRLLPHQLRHKLLYQDQPPRVIDVRERREYSQGHIPQAELVPLAKLIGEAVPQLPVDGELVLVCRTGRRSIRAACALKNRGYQNLFLLEGGMVAWEAAGYLEAIDL